MAVLGPCILGAERLGREDRVRDSIEPAMGSLRAEPHANDGGEPPGTAPA